MYERIVCLTEETTEMLYTIGEDWRIAAGVSYEDADIQDNQVGSSSDGQRYQAGAYLGRVFGAAEVGVGLSGGLADYDVTRHDYAGDRLTADQQGGFIGGSAVIRYEIALGNWDEGALSLTPELAGRVTHIYSEGFTEDGAVTALRVNAVFVNAGS